MIAFAAAGALLVAAVLPAEYGIDPTGIGGVLGLTQMGRIKGSLAEEARKEAAAPPAVVEPAPTPAVVALPAVPALPAPQPQAGQQHEMTLTLRPGQGAEITLDMRKGATVDFVWQTSGGPVNFDAHGDPPNASKDFHHGYGKGREVQADQGKLQAAFDGKHGWFWRNRGKGDVSLTLKTQGQYSAMKRVH